MTQKKEVINIQTYNGKMRIDRMGPKATITKERTIDGYKEKIVMEVTKLTDECMHHAFASEKELRQIFKNY